MEAVGDGYAPIGELWKLSDALTVTEAAALIAGLDPHAVNFGYDGKAWLQNGTGLTFGGAEGVLTAHSILRSAINDGFLPATIRRNARLQAWDEYPNPGERVRDLEAGDGDTGGVFKSAVFFCESPDWDKTTVSVADLRAWLESKPIRPAFFFPNEQEPTPADGEVTAMPAIKGETFAKLQAAYDAFPEKYGDRETVKLDTDLRDWLKLAHGCTQREADVFSSIIAEHFNLKTGRR